MALSKGLFRCATISAVGWLGLAMAGWAQSQSTITDANVGTSDVMSRVSSTLNSQSAFAPTSPGDGDLGEQLILTRNERYQSLTLFGDANEYFTTNAFLSNSAPQSDFFTQLQAGATWMPHLTGNLFGEITVRQQFYRYARFTELNFNSLDTGGGLVYVIRQLGDLSAFARYNFNLITNDSVDADLYHDQTIKFGLQKPFLLSRAHFVYTGVSAELVLEGEPGFALREKFGGYVGYQVTVTRSVKANAFYQLFYMPYLQGQRADFNQVVSGSVSWDVLPWFTVNTVVSGIFNSSNESAFQYSALNLGAGLTGQIKF